MENDEISRYLEALEREDCYRVDATLKESPHEVTQRVFFAAANEPERGPYVRKFINRESGMGGAYELIFEAQRQGLRFEHVPVIHECYHHEDLLVVVMEFVHGETLQDAVYHRDPSVQLARDVFPQLCDAVTELHEAFDPPLIHRDLKPSNVMLTDGGLTIIDFGIAREFRQGAESDTMKFGTRAFAPPEQFGFGQTTVRSDVYALGMLLYFCLTEKIPTAQARDSHFETENVPAYLRPVLVRATALDPEERYTSANALKAAFLEAVSKPAASDSPSPRKRHTAPIAIAAIAAIALVAIIALFATGAGGQSSRETSSTASSSSASEATDATNETAEKEAATAMQTGAPARNGFNPETNLTTTIAGVAFQIPNYFGARITQNGEGATYYYAESGSSLAMIMTSENPINANATNGSIDPESVKDSYLSGLAGSDESFSEVISSVDCELAGCPARIVTFRGTTQGLDITTKAVYFIDIDNSAETYTIGSLIFGQTDNAQFDYSSDFAKTIASATPA